MKRFLCICLFIIMLMPVTEALAADGSTYDFEGYIFDFWGVAQESPAAFRLKDIIDADDMSGMKMSSAADVDVSEDGRIFIVDTVECRVNVFDEDCNLLKSIKVIRDSENKIVLDEAGNQLVLTNPEGVFTHEKQNELYIADTGARRIIVLDLEKYYLKRVIEQPENLSGVTEFKPSKIAVDNADRMYIIVQSSYEGIIELYEDGTFSRYFGVNSPRVNLIDYFWKSIATDTQKEKMKKTYAPAFNNVTMDYEGFVYAVTYDTSAQDMVFRLNSSGENVLREIGNTPVIGDINRTFGEDNSEFVDVALTEYGTYALVDAKYGRIFLYDFDGEMINAFGTIGNTIGSFKKPTAIAWLGDNLVVTDTTLKCAYILEPTAFGKAVLKASEYYYYGDWDAALECYQEIIAMNVNYEIAYTGIGKNYLMKEDYEQAMYYFKLGNSRDFYSKAYNGYRSIKLRENFGYIAVLAVILLALLFYSEIRYHMKKKPA